LVAVGTAPGRIGGRGMVDDILTPAEGVAGSVDQAPREGIGLCLSGGGYRAMLFHVGALWRLNELGWLPRLSFVSSVSGGSITAGVLAVKWQELRFGDNGVATNFPDQIADPLRALANRTIDVPSVLTGIITPRTTVGDRTTASLRQHMFGAATLADLPDDPRFIITATNLSSGSLWRFSKPYMRDWQVGRVSKPSVPLAQAVAASAAFPPVLSPVTLEIDPASWDVVESKPREDLRPWPPRKIKLSDGGVYDNLGMQPVLQRCATILVSDGGGHMSYEARVASDWIQHLRRILTVVDNQVRSLRKTELIDGYKRGTFGGAYWGIRGDMPDYLQQARKPVTDALSAPFAATMKLAAIATRLASMDAATQERLINWGYAISDVAMRGMVESADRPPRFPYHRGVSA
jgi:NTE family protein